jgi:hypothetical protein
MQHLQVLENLEKKDALSAGPDFLGAFGILHATTHERADFRWWSLLQSTVASLKSYT